MKSSYGKFVILILIIGLMSFVRSNKNEIKRSKKHFPNGVGWGLSGAPNEGNCSDCHGPDVQSGSSMNILTMRLGNTIVTEYIPGQTYSLTLEMSVNPNHRGFNAVAHDPSDQVTGVFSQIVGEGAQVIGDYATHISNSNTANWKWNWTAPSTNVGDVTIYVAALKSDGVVPQNFITYLSQHTFSPSSGGIEATKNLDKYNFSAGYSSQNNTVTMSFNSLIAGEMVFNLVDLMGRSVFYYKMGTSKVGKNQEKIVLPENLKNGTYVVNMSVNNNFMEQQIIIQK